MRESHLDEHDSVFDWLLDVPRSQSVFERHGIDCSCGGKSLRYVCEQAGVDWRMIVAEITASSDPPSA
ncbi:DUF542 domain-containing protein [Rubinisphaera margarita]|uniref:DUF542 domain-containing protein n=1 Tax=Rubinisphaera margarita TaxID=2909586 RepID=UPI001EE8E4BE|nr:DUF542 domain-containing protein [Rubinisphaera margarita]MCG6154598.1 DUF542 domain-containing protein [Rubinisphaera margarita]